MKTDSKRPKHYTLHIPHYTLILLNDFNRYLSELQEEGYVVDVCKAPRSIIDKLEFAYTRILLNFIEHVMRDQDLLKKIFAQKQFSLKDDSEVEDEQDDKVISSIVKNNYILLFISII